MARLPYVDPETARAPVRDLLAALPASLNVFRMMAHAETCFEPLVRLGAAVLTAQRLPAKLRELAILHIAALSSASYEWTQHVPIAEMVGATRAQIDALERGEVEAPCFDDLERAVLRFTTEVARDVRVSDATFAEVSARLSAQEVVELLLAVGYYMLIARLLESTGVDPDAPAGDRIVRAARSGD